MMPCIKCSNGKYKYGEHGKCIYETLEKCQEAAAAIHAQESLRMRYFVEVTGKMVEVDYWEVM